jgi:hypothetical protein
MVFTYVVYRNLLSKPHCSHEQAYIAIKYGLMEAKVDVAQTSVLENKNQTNLGKITCK